MKAWRLAILILAISVVSGCGGSSVFMDYNMSGLWSNYRTWNWLPEPNAKAIGPIA